MKYLSLHALVLAGAAFTLTGCFRNFDYDVTRQRDIYRMDYKYKQPPETTSADVPPATTVPTTPPAAPLQPAPAPIPTTGVPAVPTAPAPAAAPGASNSNVHQQQKLADTSDSTPTRLQASGGATGHTTASVTATNLHTSSKGGKAAQSAARKQSVGKASKSVASVSR